MGLANTANKMKTEIANIGSKMMTGKSIEERIEELFDVKEGIHCPYCDKSMSLEGSLMAYD